MCFGQVVLKDLFMQLQFRIRKEEQDNAGCLLSKQHLCQEMILLPHKEGTLLSLEVIAFNVGMASHSWKKSHCPPKSI